MSKLGGVKRLETALVVSLLLHVSVVCLLPAESIVFVVEHQSLHGALGPQRTSRYYATVVNLTPVPQPRGPELVRAEHHRGVGPPGDKEQSGKAEGSAFVVSEKLDRLPEALGEIDLDPEEGLGHAVAGSAELQILILETGEVGFVSVNYSSFPDKYNEWLTERFAQSRFIPGFKSGIPVKTLIRIGVVVAP